ncbi:ATP synthase F1 subunit delta [Buchnera aphidicola]|uniref:ATP synthase F1 subunit delta n=1 Tax=Buchnera aphidicola TaxID=9 RepID=UPI003463EF90
MFLSEKYTTKIFLLITRRYITLQFKNFIKIIAENKRFLLLPNIFKEFINYVNKDKNLITANIISSRTLNEENIQNIRKFLKHRFLKKIDLKFFIDPSIIDGFLIKINDNVIDGTVKNNLKNLKKFISL